MTNSRLSRPSEKEKALRIGRLTIYVGAAPGVGKTYKMLQDANDWLAKGLDVVIGLIETHGRTETANQVGSLEVVPKRKISIEGREYAELDVEGILKRNPSIVLIDELAHSNVPGSERDKRYQDIEYILSQGIDVVTAVNIQHLESLRDKVLHITGILVRERVPDWFIDRADEVKLIDVSPETLQQRLQQGKIYAPEKVDTALSRFFRLANLSALRELALLEVADDIDQRRDEDRHREQGPAIHSQRDRILVCVNYRPHSESLIRRGWRIADRLQADLYVLVVISSTSMTTKEQADLDRIRELSDQFGAVFVTKYSMESSVGEVIVSVARDLFISQIIIGQPLPRKGWLAKWRANPIDYVIKQAEFVDLHVVSNMRE